MCSKQLNLFICTGKIPNIIGKISWWSFCTGPWKPIGCRFRFFRHKLSISGWLGGCTIKPINGYQFYVTFWAKNNFLLWETLILPNRAPLGCMIFYKLGDFLKGCVIFAWFYAMLLVLITIYDDSSRFISNNSLSYTHDSLWFSQKRPKVVIEDSRIGLNTLACIMCDFSTAMDCFSLYALMCFSGKIWCEIRNHLQSQRIMVWHEYLNRAQLSNHHCHPVYVHAVKWLLTFGKLT